MKSMDFDNSQIGSILSFYSPITSERRNTYALINDKDDTTRKLIYKTFSPNLYYAQHRCIFIVKTMQLQEQKKQEDFKKLMDEKDTLNIIGEDSSDDEDSFKISKRFSVVNNEYFENVYAQRISKINEITLQSSKSMINISKDETPNGLSKLCDSLNKLRYEVQDKDDKIYTNLD